MSSKAPALKTFVPDMDLLKKNARKKILRLRKKQQKEEILEKDRIKRWKEMSALVHLMCPKECDKCMENSPQQSKFCIHCGTNLFKLTSLNSHV